MKVSKVVLIVVALHVLVIGGIVVFEGCSRAKSSAPALADNESTPGQQPDATAPGTTGGQANSMPNPQGPGAGSSLTPANSMAGNEAAAPASTAASATPAASTHTYVVKKGDSLWKIAKAETVTVGELSRANNLTKTSTLKVGQKLTVPVSAKAEKASIATASVVPTSTDASGAASTTTASATPTTDAGGTMYTVKSGDSLWKIARQQSVSVAALKQANSLSGDSLKVGQKLHIPVATAKATADTAANTVSGGVAPASSAAWQSPGTYTENGQTIHVVDLNESPSTIAKKYGIKTDDLLKANNITDARKVQYGQRLVIPTQQPNAAAATPTSSTPATTPAANTTSPATTTAATPALAAPVVSASRATVQ